MLRIDRSLRFAAVAVVSALLIACGSDEATAPLEQQPPVETPPADTIPNGAPSVVGTWVGQRIDGNALPARIAGGDDEGIVWELRVLQDSLVVTANGRWVQHVRTLQTQSNGLNFPGFWGDKGTWTRTGNALHFESDWIQNVAFDAELATDGTLVVMHNFTLDDNLPEFRREMKR